MKHILFTLLFPFFLQAEELPCNRMASAYEHLVEVNRQWLLQPQTEELQQSVLFSSDRERIQLHLTLVENFLRTHTPETLTPAQRSARLHCLDDLHGYRLAGVFPVNKYHTRRQPYFQDDARTWCAVGYLMAHNGAEALSSQIAREMNYSYVSELAQAYPAIANWAVDHGFTQQELAWIQPGYLPSPDLTTWGNGQGLNPGGRINAMAVSPDGKLLYVAGKFSSIQGVAATNIAVWDGQKWSTIFMPVYGEIFDLEFWNGKLYATGKFQAFTHAANLVYYDPATNFTNALLTGYIPGPYYALGGLGDYMYVGGAFTDLKTAPYLARFGKAGSLNANEHLGISGPVYDLLTYNNRLLVAGAFDSVCTACPGGAQAAASLAWWDPAGQTWTPIPKPCGDTVQHVALLDSTLVFATSKAEVYVLNSPDSCTWLPITPEFDKQVHGFLSFFNEYTKTDMTFIYGGIRYDPLIGILGAGMLEVTPNGVQGVLNANETVRSAVVYNGDVYIAGDFTAINTKNFAGLAIMRLKNKVGIHDAQKEALQVNVTVQQPGRLQLNCPALPEGGRFRLFDIQGRIMQDKHLAAGPNTLEINSSELPADGLYFWSVETPTARRAGKWLAAR